MNKENLKPKDDRPLRTLRKEANLTQEELAKMLGVSRNNIASYEAGKYYPQFDRAVAMARALNVPLKVLAKAMQIDVNGVPNDETD